MVYKNYCNSTLNQVLHLNRLFLRIKIWKLLLSIKENKGYSKKHPVEKSFWSKKSCIDDIVELHATKILLMPPHHEKKIILEIFNTNISHKFFLYKITFVISQHENTNSKGILYLKTRFKWSLWRFLVLKDKSRFKKIYFR